MVSACTHRSVCVSTVRTARTVLTVLLHCVQAIWNVEPSARCEEPRQEARRRGEEVDASGDERESLSLLSHSIAATSTDPLLACPLLCSSPTFRWPSSVACYAIATPSPEVTTPPARGEYLCQSAAVTLSVRRGGSCGGSHACTRDGNAPAGKRHYRETPWDEGRCRQAEAG